MTEKKLVNPFREKLELLILTESEEALNRARQVVSSYFLTFKHRSYSALEKDNLQDLTRALLVLLVQEKSESLKAFSQRVDQALIMFPRSRFITVMAPNYSRENLEGTHSPRVNALSQGEFYSTLKFEYLCLYRCRAQYYEVQLADFFPMTTMLLPSYIRMPLNQRYLGVIYSNTILTDERFARLEKAKGLYIRTKDSPKYLEYVNTYYDMSGAALKKRARALFLALSSSSLYLNESILFDFKSNSDEYVANLYEELKKMATDLFVIMRSEEDLWDTFREAWENEFSPFWRGPWIATYAALISIKSGVGDPLVTFLSGLLMDIGLYDLEEEVTRHYLLADDKSIPDVQKTSFEKHPLLSLNRCLIKKLPIEESVKAVIVCTHEHADETGFPNQVPQDKLPVEAQLLMLAEKIDQETLTTMKKTGVGFRFLKEKLWEAEKASGKNFNADFLNTIAQALI